MTVLPSVMVGLLYFLGLLSAVAAFVYESAWVRRLIPVVGGSTLAVTTVVCVSMAGLALGGHAFGRRVDRTNRPLRLLAVLQFAAAVWSLVFMGLLRIYPALYVFLARGGDERSFRLNLVRVVLSAVALAVPAMLIGGTLPVLSRAVCLDGAALRRHLPFLHAVGALGVALGVLLAGVVFHPRASVDATLAIAATASALVGLACLLVPGPAPSEPPTFDAGSAAADLVDRASDSSSLRLVWSGIGLSGFCALGYEVLWARALAIVVGASVYGFTVVLVAFMAGIAIGSLVYGVSARLFGGSGPRTGTAVAWFGFVHVAIGIAALATTAFVGLLPAHAVALQVRFSGSGVASFQARALAGFLLAGLFVAVPAVFIGAAFPLAGEALARGRDTFGRTVGRMFAAMIVGALLGIAIGGLLMVRFFGIERSLEMLAVVNVGLGLMVLAGRGKTRWLPGAVAAATLAVVAVLAVTHDAASLWDRRYFAVFRNNQPEAFATPDKAREAVENTDILYYAEGVESTLSAIRVKGGDQAILADGRIEGSTLLASQQSRLALGALPALLGKNPRDVLVVGLGTGMTAEAAADSRAERVTVVDSEPRAVGAARTFGPFNHGVLDNPKVHIAVNDERNYLVTTDRTFDVIAVDPKAPGFDGSGYLYSSEFFALAASRLRPGGIFAERLALDGLAPQELASVIGTFQLHFANTLMWLVHDDVVILGRRIPVRIDQAAVERRMAGAALARDLAGVEMGSAADLLSYFVMGTEGMARLGRAGVPLTDQRLAFQFSAPGFAGDPGALAANLGAVAAGRESMLAYLEPAPEFEARARQTVGCAQQLAAGRISDRALAMLVGGRSDGETVGSSLRRLNLEYPWYAPGRFLWAEYQAAQALEPRLLLESSLMLAGEGGSTVVVDMAAVLVPVSKTRASVMFVDGRTREVYGQLYVDHYEQTGFANRFAEDVMAAIHAVYESATAAAHQREQSLPLATDTMRTIKTVVGSKIRSARPGV